MKMKANMSEMKLKFNKKEHEIEKTDERKEKSKGNIRNKSKEE